MYEADTIVAIATAPSPAAVGIVRLSGPQADPILQQLLGGAPRRLESHRLRLSRIFAADGSLLDEALVTLMRGPASYTGEDVAEIHCHGSVAVLREVVAAALSHGARLAEPGELTRRAFLNGRIDLVQAEAVDDLIRARGRGAASAAVQQVAGRLSEEIAAVREQLIDLKSLLEVQIDFSDEDVSIDAAELRKLAVSSLVRLENLVASYERGRLVRDGLRVAIVGRPNVGKSSLLNALLGDERAIVTEIAGTTRDVIEESIELAGLRLVLSDTAGVRAEAEADRVERIGIDRTRREIANADLVLLVLDGSLPLTDDDLRVFEATSDLPRLCIVNKSDLPPVVAEAELFSFAPEAPVVRLSARSGAGLEDLRNCLRARLETGVQAVDSALVTRLRHRDCLAQAAAAVALALGSIEADQTADLIAVDVQQALEQIAELTGAITHEDVLDRIFAKFCLGK